jgi:hypothetical protein
MPMTGLAQKDTIKTITTHYIDGGYVESHGREVMDLIRPRIEAFLETRAISIPREDTSYD